ncbi:MAG: type II toxin-antitoxin system PemK/MazF family toxin [Spirochaetota bacterium]
MVTVSRGEIWWADLSEPIGSSPGFRRPLIIVQGDALNRSKICTVICVPLTSNVTWAGAPGNVLLSTAITGLSKESVANVYLIWRYEKHRQQGSGYFTRHCRQIEN